MPSLSPRLQLILPDDPDTQDIDQLNANFLSLDKNVGIQHVTSTTRPTGTDRYAGKLIYETDTKTMYMWDGTDWMYIGAALLGGIGGSWHSVAETKGTWTATIRRHRISEDTLLLSGTFTTSSTNPFTAGAAFNTIVDGWTPHPNDFPEWCKTTVALQGSGNSNVITDGVIAGGGQNAPFHVSVAADGAISARVQTTINPMAPTYGFNFGPVILARTS